MTKNDARAIAKEIAQINPYKNKAIKFFIGGVERYILNDKVYTNEEITNVYIETATKDIINGYKERMVGYYDKWYRYNRADEGRAYDKGVRLAADNCKCKEELHIIECSY